MTSDDIREALREAVRPLSQSVKELDNKFNDFHVKTVGALTEIRTDMKHVRRECSSLGSDVKDLREKWPLMESHMRREEDTGVHRLAMAVPPLRPSGGVSVNNGNARISLPRAALRWIPWIIVAALLGAALVGGLILQSSNDALDKATKRLPSVPAAPEEVAP